MGLNKSKGNMYDWVSHMHNHLAGECQYNCSYCYVKGFSKRTPKYQGELRLVEDELKVNYRSPGVIAYAREKGFEEPVIFIGNCNDLFASNVPGTHIKKVLDHCCQYPENTYVFQTKNPSRYWQVPKILWPKNIMLGCTIESNRHYPEISSAPKPQIRAGAMLKLNYNKFVTIEPILDNDPRELAEMMYLINPTFINIGADSNNHGLPEPSKDKLHQLIQHLNEYGLVINKKHNLDRILRTPGVRTDT